LGTKFPKQLKAGARASFEAEGGGRKRRDRTREFRGKELKGVKRRVDDDLLFSLIMSGTRRDDIKYSKRSAERLKS
jgi:hypothetical protein